MPRRNNKSKGRGFESMSGAKVKALEESLHFEWKRLTQPWSRELNAPAPRERW